MSRTARLAPIGFAAAIAAALGSATAALAFDKVDNLQPIQAGRGYVYYVHEVDVQKQPVQGRTVTVNVGKVPGRDATVAPADAQGHATGPAGAAAQELSGTDGLAYFLLRTSTTPGVNEFTWTDTTWTGEVLVTGQPAPSSSPAAGSGAAAGSSHGGTASGAGGSGGSGKAASASTAARTPGRGVPPVAAGLAAMVLAWLVLPPVLARRRGTLAMPALPGALPTAAAPPR